MRIVLEKIWFVINRYHVLWPTLLMLAMIIITYLAFTSQPPDITLQLSDKSNHLLAFFALNGLVWLSAPALLARLRLGLLMSYGILIELLQNLIKARHSSGLDVAADAAGLLIAECLLIAFCVLSHRYCLHQPNYRF